MIGDNPALGRARDMLGVAKSVEEVEESAEHEEAHEMHDGPAEIGGLLHLKNGPGGKSSPMPTLTIFKYEGSGDAREAFSQAKDKVPPWSGRVINLNGEGMVIGSAQKGSDDEQGIDIVCRDENMQRVHAVIYYRHWRQCWVLESLGGRCMVGSARKN